MYDGEICVTGFTGCCSAISCLIFRFPRFLLSSIGVWLLISFPKTTCESLQTLENLDSILLVTVFIPKLDDVLTMTYDA